MPNGPLKRQVSKVFFAALNAEMVIVAQFKYRQRHRAALLRPAQLLRAYDNSTIVR